LIVPAVTFALSPVDVLADRVPGPALSALELFCVYLGTQLGRYGALAERGPRTADGRARVAGIASRSARAWSEQGRRAVRRDDRSRAELVDGGTHP